MAGRRIPMETRLTARSFDSGVPHRAVRDSDGQDLAILLYAAYRGTIDDEKGTFDDAVAEIDGFFEGTYGRFFPDCSFVIEEGEFLVSASLVTWWEPHDAPLLAFAMTRPEAQRRGLARRLIEASMNALLDRAYTRLTLLVTDGNTPAQNLYRSLGFRRFREPRRR